MDCKTYKSSYIKQAKASRIKGGYMRSFYSKHFRIKAVLKKLLREDLKKRKNYELFCRLIASLGIFVILAFLLTVLFWQSEISQNNHHLQYYVSKSAGVCCHKCALAKKSASDETCYSAFKWPVKHPRIVKAFNPPPKPWMAGHRGVDLAAPTGTLLFAPADGVISFAGKVAGKSVVTIRHGELTSTFEPAVTKFSVGVSVKQGQNFAHVEGGSDHCKNTCVQWGLKRKNRTYANPVGMTARRRIVLKPVE